MSGTVLAYIHCLYKEKGILLSLIISICTNYGNLHFELDVAIPIYVCNSMLLIVSFVSFYFISFLHHKLKKKNFCFLNWEGKIANNMLTAKHNACIVDSTICFPFDIWFAFNDICFCLELVKIMPSWNTKSRFMF